MRTIGDLASFLEREGLSPEELSRKVPISNMTLRRLLRRSPRTRLPEKYQRLLSAMDPSEVAVGRDLQENFGILLSDLEESGKLCADVSSLRKEVKGKLSVAKLGREFTRLVSVVAKRTTCGSARERALAIGALLYFVNPFDAIPDALPGIGYLDDFAVLTLVAGLIARGALNSRGKSGS